MSRLTESPFSDPPAVPPAATAQISRPSHADYDSDGLSTANGLVRRAAPRRAAHLRRTDVRGVRPERQEQEVNNEGSSSQPAWLGAPAERGGARARRGAGISGLGALLVGYYDGDDLVFAGKIGTGFDTRLLLDQRARLDQLEIAATPFTRAVGLPRLRPLGAPRDRRPGRLHRVDRARQASPPATARRPHRQAYARGRQRDVAAATAAGW